MLSKFLQPCRIGALTRCLLVAKPVLKVAVRSSNYLPKSQYDMAYPNKFRLGYACRVHWELIPVFVVTIVSFGIMFGILGWKSQNQMDIVFSTNNRNNLSRTMDMRHPTIHKLRIINQKYEPWPEMAEVLDKMTAAEKRLMSRAESCGA